jgi:hypothetical protein
MADDDSPGPFRVLISGARMEELDRMTRVATAVGRRGEVLRWLRELDFRLTREPHEWGESREVLPVLQLEIRFGTVGDITVWYGVNVETRTVYVKRFRLRGDRNPGTGAA